MSFVRWQQHVNEQVLTRTDAIYRLWVSADRCTLVRLWATGVVEVAVRDNPAQTWGPPTELTEEKA